MKNIIYLVIIFLSSISYSSSQSSTIRKSIEDYSDSKIADIGVAIISLENGDTITIGNDRHYPMQSVYKFHLSLAVLDQVDKGKFSLDQKIHIKSTALLPNTWSPLKEKYPNVNIDLSLGEIINYTISQSDNNGCDILFKLIGGPPKVDKYIKSLGIKDISIKATEKQMHNSDRAQYTNWSTPLATAELLVKFYKGNILSQKSFIHLLTAMENTTTGPDRIKGLLPSGTIVAHKTGSSGTNDEGITAALNDVGIVTLPNGKHFAIVIFVSNSKEDEQANAMIIADITKMVWDHFNK